MIIRDRVKELRRVPASQLKANAKNWRTHGQAQADALRGLLAEVGFAGAALAYELPDGSLELIDGHLRTEVTGDAIVPVLVLDVTAEEADKLLATFDPLGAMATADAAKLDALLNTVHAEHDGLIAMLDGLAHANGLTEESPAAPEESPVPQIYSVIVDLPSRAEQVALLQQLAGQGFTCRGATS